MTFARGINCNLVVERFSMSENKLLEYKTLSLSQARGMVDAVIFAAQKIDFPGVAVVVVDKAGDIIASARMDGKAGRFFKAAHRKAYTGAIFERDTSGVIKFWNEQQAKGHRGPTDWNDTMLTTLPGGYAVYYGAHVVGGLGVAGGFGDMPDAEFADIGIASLGPEYRHSEDWDWMKNYVPR